MEFIKVSTINFSAQVHVFCYLICWNWPNFSAHCCFSTLSRWGYFGPYVSLKDSGVILKNIFKEPYMSLDLNVFLFSYLNSIKLWIYIIQNVISALDLYTFCVIVKSTSNIATTPPELWQWKTLLVIIINLWWTSTSY